MKTSKAGHSEAIETPGGVADVNSGNPFMKRPEKQRPTTVKMLFTDTYSASYHGTASDEANKRGTKGENSTERTSMSLIKAAVIRQRARLRNFLQSIRSRINASWTKRKGDVGTSKPRGVVPPSS